MSAGLERAGAVNAHTHLYSGLAPLGLPSPQVPPRTFVEILERVWWRLDRALDRASLRASARLSLAEALLAGTTTVVDHHESPSFIEGSLDVLADAAQELGIRLIVAYGATERNGGRAEAQRGLAECRRFITSNRRPLVRGMVGLHASFTCSDDTLREAGSLARELGTAVHVHLAEDLVDVQDARKRGYAGPLQRLLTLEALPPGSVLAHGVHLTPEEVTQADADGLWLVQNPRSNQGNRVGYARELWRSDKLALGTDGYPSDMAVERATLLRLALDANIPEDLARLERRAAGGHDIANARFAEDLVDLVEGDGGQVRRALIAGRLVVNEGRLTRADLAEIREDARAQAELLFRRMKALP